jgi:SAM-dependent methyltransferase
MPVLESIMRKFSRGVAAPTPSRPNYVSDLTGLRCLEIGPGDKPVAGFEALNIVDDGVSDHVANAGKRLPFDDNTFDIVYASHILEHVPWTHTLQTLKEWRRIIKRGGVLEVWVPDGLKICQKFVEAEVSGQPFTAPDGWYKFNPDKDPCVWAAGRIFTYGDGQGTLGDPNWHLALFSPRYLSRILTSAGFTNVVEQDRSKVRGFDHGWINLGFKATK